MDVKKILSSLKQKQVPPLGDIPDAVQDALATAINLRGKVSRLSSLERVLATVRHKEPDRVPVATLVNAGARKITGVSFPDYSIRAEKAAEVFEASVRFIGGDLSAELCGSRREPGYSRERQEGAGRPKSYRSEAVGRLHDPSSTPTLSHSSSTTHSVHSGCRAVQTARPCRIR